MDDSHSASAERRALGGDFHLATLPPGSPATHRVDVGFRHPEWRPRRPEGPGRAPFPGSAVLLDSEWYEIVRAAAVAGPPPRYSYELWPWDDAFPLRRVYELTPEACTRVTAEHWQRRRRQHHGEILGALPFLVGLLPAEDQRRIELRYGVPAGRNTAITAMILLFLSVVVLFLAFALSKGHHFGAWQPLVKGVARWWLLFAYLGLESYPRLASGARGEPVGSLPVALPILAVRWLRRELAPAQQRQVAADRAHRRGDRTFAEARDEVRRLAGGEHDLEVISLLPKDHWRANVTGIRWEGEVYVLDERQLIRTAAGVRHRFLLLRPRHEVLYSSFFDYRPEEVREVYRARRRRDAATWAKTFGFLWGFADGETQHSLARTYSYAPWRYTRFTVVGAAVVGAFFLSTGLGSALGGAPTPVNGVQFLFGIFLLWEAAVRWRSYRGGEIRGSLFGFLLRPLTARLLRWEGGAEPSGGGAPPQGVSDRDGSPRASASTPSDR